jgi:thiol-disulfide isomerase/thioredoxin
MKIKPLIPLFIILFVAALPLLLTLLSGESTRAGVAPELKGIHEWFNSGPLTMAELRGKVVLVDFWTYSCVNCIRTFPYLKAWDERYRDMGLVIIGVHSPEFGFEKDARNVKSAIDQFGLDYPIAMDNDKRTWKAYANRFWPHKYLIDAQGNIRYEQIGEGGYIEMEQKVRDLLKEADYPLEEGTTRVVAEEVQFKEIKTPELYFGNDRGGCLGNPRGFRRGPVDYLKPSTLVENLCYLVGEWAVGPENAEFVGAADGEILLKYTAKAVNMVAGAPGRDIPVEVLRDGNPLTKANAGKDIQFDERGRSMAFIQEERLYSLIHDQTGYGLHDITLIMGKKGFKIYTFTFG